MSKVIKLIQFKFVQFIICKLYLNEAIKKFNFIFKKLSLDERAYLQET